MKQQFEKRLSELKVEYESGQQMLADLETKQANLRATLLRISGAIQVIEEELARENEAGDGVKSETDEQAPHSVVRHLVEAGR